MYRFVAWADNKGFKSHVLLPEATISKVLESLKQSKEPYNIYTTIQTYDSDRTPISAPIWADFDGIRAKTDAMRCIRAFDLLYGSTPHVWFSGNRGYHLVWEVSMPGILAHYIARILISELDDYQSLDKNVYTEKRLWRVENTINTKGNLYKIPLTIDELEFLSEDDIRQLAKSQRNFKKDFCVYSQTLDNRIQEIITGINKKKKNSTSVLKNNTDVFHDMPPCIRQLLFILPEVGDRNRSVYILARYFHGKGISIDEADHLINMIERDGVNIQSVLRSTYNGDVRSVGCKNSTDGDILRKYCHPMCWILEEQ